MKAPICYEGVILHIALLSNVAKCPYSLEISSLNSGEWDTFCFINRSGTACQVFWAENPDEH